MHVYLASRPRAPWGDYGKILIHGMSRHLPRVAGAIQLERTAPFIPPITFPGLADVVVTDAFRKKLEASGLTGCSFAPVRKRRIVALAWEHWDRSAKKPRVFPASGEPEDYLLAGAHDRRASAALGDLWEMIVGPIGTAQAERPRRPGERWKVTAQLPPDPPDLLHAVGFRLLLVSARAKTWLEQSAPGCVDFDRVKVEK